MEIATVQALALAIPLKPLSPQSAWSDPLRKQLIVRVVTDEGLLGTGEAFAYGAPLAVANVIEESLAPLLIGQDPRRIEALVDQMHRATMIYARRGLGMFAISGVEIALWDLLGRILDTPVWRLLEGQARRRLPAYTSLLRYDVPSDVATVCRRSLALGFRKLKLHQTDVASVRAARKAVGPDVELMLDVNCAWNPDEAIAMARELVPHHLSWLEEPVWPPEDYEGLRRVSEAAGTPIALGENESTLFGFREIITHRAGAILQPSVIKVGGISEMMKIAAMANRANLAIAPHSFYFGPGLAATLHVAASLTKEVAIELPACELEVPFLNDPIVARDGWVEVPDGPGLGVTVNDDAVRRYPYSPDAAQPFVIGAR